MEHLEQLLQQSLYRLECPSAAELRDYSWQFLPTEKMRVVDTHLTECPHCQSELEVLKNEVSEIEENSVSSPVFYDWLEGIRVIFATLLNPALQLRGQSDPSRRVFEAEETIIEIGSERLPSGDLTINGQVLTLDTLNTIGSYVRFTALDETAIRVRSELEEDGSFHVSLATGEYQMVVHLSEQHIVIPSVELP